jgi:hypothetical protein
MTGATVGELKETGVLALQIIGKKAATRSKERKRIGGR